MITRRLLRHEINHPPANHHNPKGLSNEEARKRLLEGLNRLILPNANLIPRIACLIILYISPCTYLTVALIIDVIIELQIQRLRYLEIHTRLTHLDDLIKNVFDHPKLAHVANLVCFTVLRSGHRHILPELLLAKGDIVLSLEKPNIPCDPLHNQGEWKLNCTPLQRNLEKALKLRRFSFTSLDVSFNIFVTVGSVLSLFVLRIQFFWSHVLILACLPILKNCLYLFCNTRLHILQEHIVCSKSNATKNEDFDEFDEDEITPVSDNTFDSLSILNAMFRNLVRVNGLFWNFDICHLLSSVTYFAYLDQTHLLSSATLSPDQLLLAHGESNLAIRVIKNENSSELFLEYDEDDISLDALKALGLSLALWTSCGFDGSTTTHSINSKQMCPCSLAKAIGFKPGILDNYKVIDQLRLRLHHDDAAVINAKMISDPSGNKQLFAAGPLNRIIQLCKFSWDGSDFSDFDLMRRQLEEICKNLELYGYSTLAFSYRPLKSENSICRNRNHIFLGFLLYCKHVQPKIPDLIEDLGHAGIRFVFFSQESEIATKTFGARLGLDTDWNSCILFSHPTINENLLSLEAHQIDFSDPKSKLPRGVHNVRPHLENVDDIPLRISLFAECDKKSVREMIRIYKEYDEVVASAGLSNSIDNLEIFSECHLSIAMELPCSEGNGPYQTFLSSVVSILSPLKLSSSQCSTQFLCELMCESRRLSKATISALSFYCLMAVYLTIVGFPHFGCLFLSAIVCFTFLFAPAEPKIMNEMPGTLSTCLLLVFNFYTVDEHISRKTAVWTFIKGVANLVVTYSVNHTLHLISSQSIFSLIAVSSSSHMHLVESLKSFNPLRNYTWSAVSAAILFLGLITNFSDTIKGVMGGIICLAFAESFKHFWRQEVYLRRRRAKLEFNTRLGMHSPR